MSDMAKRYDEFDATEKQVANSAIQQLKRWIDEASHLVFLEELGFPRKAAFLTSGKERTVSPRRHQSRFYDRWL